MYRKFFTNVAQMPILIFSNIYLNKCFERKILIFSPKIFFFNKFFIKSHLIYYFYYNNMKLLSFWVFKFLEKIYFIFQTENYKIWKFIRIIKLKKNILHAERSLHAACTQCASRTLLHALAAMTAGDVITLLCFCFWRNATYFGDFAHT